MGMILMAGCNGNVGEGSLCAAASEHVSQCTGGKAHVNPNVCEEDAAAALLQTPCEALQSRSSQSNFGDLFGGLFGGMGNGGMGNGGMGNGYGNDCYVSPQTGQQIGNCNGGYSGGCGGGGKEWCGLLGDLLGTMCKMVTGGSHDTCYDNAYQNGFEGDQDCYCNPQTGKCIGSCNGNGYNNGVNGWGNGTGSSGWGNEPDGWGNEPDGWGNEPDGWGNEPDGWGNQPGNGTSNPATCTAACQVAMNCTKFFSSATICQQRLCPGSDASALAALAGAGANCSQAFMAFMALAGN
jgi:hypothetical protein